ncbi:MAG: hypothetical protein DI616_15655 [Paracoccus denitrificans]|uniref:Uncharacterized protein n=1 Tax=Paracoccus denitrificans TaxID=266 RepID=A0A533I3D8_PARDE|nr:MAG: hypothetical protein DI616_15655 [Paracoccus denitrificans]
MDMQAKKALMADMYTNQNKSLKEIGLALNVAPTTVWHHLNRMGIKRRAAHRRAKDVPYSERRKKQPRFTHEQHSEMIHLYTNVNKTLEELSMIYGVSRSSISTWLKKANVKLRAPSRRRTSVGYVPNPRKLIINERIIKNASVDRSSGVSWREIASRYDISVSYIRRKVLEYEANICI